MPGERNHDVGGLRHRQLGTNADGSEFEIADQWEF
jgi:hypothetical protein